MNIVTNHEPPLAVRRTFAAFASALVLGATLGGPVAAQELPKSVTVPFRDLNLSAPQGAARLLQRITTAADQVCGDRFIPDLTARHLQAVCRNEAVERAVHELDVPMVTALAHRDAAPIALAGG